MTTTVKQQAIHISSQKANLVCDLVRNKSVKEATIILDNTPQKAARFIKKLLHAAMSNATNNHAMVASNLYIYQITANQGKTLKRMIPRAKGSGSSIRKRFVTIILTLSDDKDQKKKDLAAVKARMAKRNQSKLAHKVEATKEVELMPGKKAEQPKIKLAKEQKAETPKAETKKAETPKIKLDKGDNK